MGWLKRVRGHLGRHLPTLPPTLSSNPSTPPFPTHLCPAPMQRPSRTATFLPRATASSYATLKPAMPPPTISASRSAGSGGAPGAPSAGRVGRAASWFQTEAVRPGENRREERGGWFFFVDDAATHVPPFPPPFPPQPPHTIPTHFSTLPHSPAGRPLAASAGSVPTATRAAPPAGSAGAGENVRNG